MKSLNNLLDKYRQVKIVNASTLFDIEPSWELLKTNQCPICGNKLLFLRGRPMAICKGKRHGDKKSFTISVQKLAQQSHKR